jgi:acetyl esterase/lipase
MAIRLLLRKRNEFKKPATAVRENNFEYWKTGMNHFGVVERAIEDLAPDRRNRREMHAKSLIGVAPAYVEIGELDIFRNDDIDYARRIACAGISMELHVHAGAPHAFDLIAPHSDLVQRCMADRARVLKAL